jgi:nucleotide-binding universal stress UspA family protein
MEERADDHLASQEVWPVRGVYTKILVANDDSDGAFKALTTALKLLQQSGTEFGVSSVPGHPVLTILNFARDRGFDLLIIGFG